MGRACLSLLQVWACWGALLLLADHGRGGGCGGAIACSALSGAMVQAAAGAAPRGRVASWWRLTPLLRMRGGSGAGDGPDGEAAPLGVSTESRAGHGRQIVVDSGEIELIERPPSPKAEHFEVDGTDDGARVFDFSKLPEPHAQTRFHEVASCAAKLVGDGGVCIEQIRAGTGTRVPRDGDFVYIHYRAFVMGGDGREFDNSRTSDQRNGMPFGFTMVHARMCLPLNFWHRSSTFFSEEESGASVRRACIVT
jgi:hypothetical protein